MLTLPEIRKALLAYRARETPAEERPRSEAAVALVLHPGASGQAELLFIERARQPGDPWSGQMAFPGGRRHAEDAHLAHTARRETEEEVGLSLGEPIGRLDDVSGTRHPHISPLVVAPFVYQLPERGPLALNHEVADTVWIPLEWILDPRSAVPYRLRRAGYENTFPAFRYDRYTVWGLTYRMLGNLAVVLGRELPPFEDLGA